MNDIPSDKTTMPATIRDALANAARAYCCDDGECPCGHYSQCLIAVTPEALSGVAAAVVAFLRSLPPHITLPTGNGHLLAGMSGFGNLAQAVEQAAAPVTTHAEARRLGL